MSHTILITGATGGLGTAVVRTLSEKGYSICVTTRTSHAPDAFADRIVDAHPVDLTDAQETQEYLDTLIRRFALEAAVLLVGGFAMGTIHDTDSTMIDRQITLNFKTAYNVVRPLLAHFEKRGGGQFILISARPALMPEAGKGMIAYALSKSLVVQLAQLINAHGKGKGIHATVLVPSTIDTPANRKAMPDADTGSWVKAEDLAETIAFVLSDAGAPLRDTVLKVYGDA